MRCGDERRTTPKEGRSGSPRLGLSTHHLSGRVVEHRAGRRPRFCSSRCRNRENGRGRVRKALLGRDTGAPAKLQKKDSKLKALQRAKTLSSHRILAPAAVLAVEVFDRAWTPAVSSGGVAVEVGRLRARALVTP
jgi:hypothetical protein